MKRTRTVRLGLFVLALLASLVPPSQGLLRAQVRADTPGTLYLPLVMRRYTPFPTIYLPLVMHQYTPFPSIFGVRMQAVSDSFGLQQALEARVRTVRSVTFFWSWIEPYPPSSPYHAYRWWTVDEASLIAAADNHLDVIANIHWTPDWAQLWPGIGCGPIHPDQLGAFAQFLQELVGRYSQHPYHVHHWVIWNEPDVDPDLVNPSSYYGCWGDGDDPYYGGGRYGEMLQVAYPAIKAADPDAEVIVGGLLLDSPTTLSSKFTEGILLAGGGPYFDALAFHAFTNWTGTLGEMTNDKWPGSVTAVPDKAAFLKGVLEQYGFGDKPLLVTEASMQCFKLPPDPPSNDCLETQAMYVPRVYAEGLSLGLTHLIYYSLVDDWVGRNNGLLRETDLSKKPSYYAYKTAISFLAGAHYITPVSGYPVGIEGYSSQLPNSTDVDVIWSADGTPVRVYLPAGVVAYDRYGTVFVSPPDYVDVDYSPVYVVRP
jgi:hypothetical protein